MVREGGQYLNKKLTNFAYRICISRTTMINGIILVIDSVSRHAGSFVDPGFSYGVDL
jgi:hypothetical protein